MDKERLAENIKNARKLAGLTQTQLAEKIGIKYQGIAQWESGKRVATLETIEKIAKACNTYPICLISGVFDD